MRASIYAILVLALLTTALIPAIAFAPEDAQAAAIPRATRQTAITDVPVWNVGDAWHVVEYIKQDDGTIMNIDRWFNVTLITNQGGFEVYKLEFEGSIVMSASGLTMRSDTYTGYYMFRTSDLALVKVYEDASGQYDELPGYTWTLTETITHAPPEEDYDFPLGDTAETWTMDTWGNGSQSMDDGVTGTTTTPINQHLTLAYSCPGIVSQTVPAGTFDCIDAHATIGGGGTDDHYYNSTVGWDVYRISSNFGGIQTAWTKLKSYYRAGQAAVVSVDLIPSSADYSDQVVVNGTATKKSDGTPLVTANVNIEVPNSGVSSQSVNTDANGKFTATFNAPTMNDRTPCNKDKGSWGVLAKVTGGTPGWGAATITLITPPRPDLKILDSDLTNDTGSAPAYTGLLINISANVHNIGPGAGNNVNVKFYDGTTLLKQTNLTSLASSGSQKAYLDWTPTTTGKHDLIVKVNEAQSVIETNYANNIADMNITVVAPYGVNLTCAAPLQYLDRGESATFTVVVKNTGVLMDTIGLELYSIPAGCAATKNKDLANLNGGSTDNVIVTFDVPYDATGGQTKTMQMNATSVGDPAQKAVITLSVYINKVVSLDLYAPVTELGTLPGEGAAFTITANNTGNVGDTYAYTYGNMMTDWAAMFAPDQVIVAANASGNTTLTVTPPYAASPGTEQTVVIKATSTANSTVQKTLSLKVKVLEVLDLSVDIDPLSISVDPDETAIYTITLENNGNAQKTFEYEIVGVPDGWTTDIATSTKVKPDESKDVTLEITPASDALAGAYPLRLNITVQGLTLSYSYNLTLTVKPVYSIALATTSKLTWSLKPSDKFEINISVKNNGNAEDIIDIQAVNMSSEWTMAGNSTLDAVKLMPGETVLLTLTITTSAAEGTSVFQIKAASRSDTDATSAKSYTVTLSTGGITPDDDDDTDDDIVQDDDDAKPQSTDNTLMYVLIALLAVFMIIVLVVIVVMMRRKQEKPMVIVEPAPTVEPSPAAAPTKKKKAAARSPAAQARPQQPNQAALQPTPAEITAPEAQEQMPSQEPQLAIDGQVEHVQPDMSVPEIPADGPAAEAPEGEQAPQMNEVFGEGAKQP